MVIGGGMNGGVVYRRIMKGSQLYDEKGKGIGNGGVVIVLYWKKSIERIQEYKIICYYCIYCE